LDSVCYGSGKFVAVGIFGYIITSTDGINWTESMPIQVGNNSWKSVCYGRFIGGGKFVAVGDVRYITTSTDGINWTTPIQLKDENGNIPENFLYGICPF
jgi:hypothetical protein